MPGWNDKLLQEVIRSILEAYYEPKFSDASHGFRQGRGCHTALERIKEKGKGTKWFVEGDIRSCFDKIEFSVLLNILKKDFKDNRLILLIRRMLEAGYMEDKVFNQTYSGVPQGGIASPILTNLVLNELDKYIEGTLIPEFNKGTKRTHNNAYKRCKDRERHAKKKGKKEEAKRHRKASLKLSSRIPDDPDYKKMWYVRYADDWLVGVIGSKFDANIIKEKIATYLKESLRLELSEEKTLITHARTEKANFLGYHIHVLHDDGRHYQGKRTINGKIGLTIPKKVISNYRSRYMRRGKPVHRSYSICDEPFSTISHYQAEYRGIVQYYKMAFNLHKMSHLKHTMEVSLVKTLAAKYKTSCHKIYKEYQTSIETTYGKRKVLQVIIKRKGKNPLKTHFGGISLIWQKKTKLNDLKAGEIIWSTRTELIERLMADQCELCQSTKKVEVHHIRKIADIKKKGKEPRQNWEKRMIARNRKTLVVCRKCHTLIHTGKYDGQSLKRKSTGEPRAAEMGMRGSVRGN